jgi:hypothetical protein
MQIFDDRFQAEAGRSIVVVVSASEDINLHKNVHSIFEYRGSAVLLVVIINLMKFLDYVH